MRTMQKISPVVLFMGLCVALLSARGEMMEGNKTAMLTGAKGHHASGTVEFVKDKMGHQKLVFHDLKIDKVPDGRVYLAKDGDYAKGIEIGRLTRFSGKIEFPVAVSVNPGDYNSVVVWCKKFNVEIGRAMFDTGMGMMKSRQGP